jgi:hypothetical protein
LLDFVRGNQTGILVGDEVPVVGDDVEPALQDKVAVDAIRASVALYLAFFDDSAAHDDRLSEVVP